MLLSCSSVNSFFTATGHFQSCDSVMLQCKQEQPHAQGSKTHILPDGKIQALFLCSNQSDAQSVPEQISLSLNTGLTIKYIKIMYFNNVRNELWFLFLYFKKVFKLY